MIILGIIGIYVMNENGYFKDWNNSCNNDLAIHNYRCMQATTRRRWVDELPAGWRVVGRLLYCQLPHVTPKGSAAGFAEMDDNFEF